MDLIGDFFLPSICLVIRTGLRPKASCTFSVAKQEHSIKCVISTTIFGSGTYQMEVLCTVPELNLAGVRIHDFQIMTVEAYMILPKQIFCSTTSSRGIILANRNNLSPICAFHLYVFTMRTLLYYALFTISCPHTVQSLYS